MKMQKKIEEILMDMIKSIKIYTIDKDNSVFDVDYQKFSTKIIDLINDQKTD